MAKNKKKKKINWQKIIVIIMLIAMVGTYVAALLTGLLEKKSKIFALLFMVLNQNHLE